MRHRHILLASLATLSLLAGLASVGPVAPAYAEPTPTATGAAGQQVCTIRESGLDEASGLTATPNGYAVIGDGGDSLRVHLFDGTCKRTGIIRTNADPFDPEDLGIDAQGTLWVGDIGDNDRERETVAIFKVPLKAPQSGPRAQLFRMKYPDGPKDAEALLVPPQGLPIIVTKQVGGAALYTPTSELDANRRVPLRKVGEITLKPSGTSGGPIGSVGQTVITGGAMSPDGRKVVLRTYTDAYEWDVTGNDVAGAITKGKPRRTPLPNEPQGEAITYTRDGKFFVTISETPQGGRPALRRYQPATVVSSPSVAPHDSAEGPGLFDAILDTLGLSGLMWVVVGIGVLGLVLVIVGGLGIRSSRKRRRDEEARDNTRGSRSRGREPTDRWDDANPPPDDTETDVIPRVVDNGDYHAAEDPYSGPYERARRRRRKPDQRYATYDEYYDQDQYDRHDQGRSSHDYGADHRPGYGPGYGPRHGDYHRDREPEGPRWRG